MTTPKLKLVDDEALLASGGTVVYAVALDGRRIGWVGDTRPWRGWRFGGRQWWACWREDGDDAARWNSFSEVEYHSRAAAVADLVERVRSAGSPEEVPRG